MMPRISPRVFVPAQINLRTMQAPARWTKLEMNSYQHLYFTAACKSSRIKSMFNSSENAATKVET